MEDLSKFHFNHYLENFKRDNATALTCRKIARLKAQGYETNGISMIHKDTGQLVIVDDFGKVSWMNNNKETG